MSTSNSTKFKNYYREDEEGRIWVRGDVLNQLMRWIGNIQFSDGLGSVAYNDNGINLSLDLDAVVSAVAT